MNQLLESHKNHNPRLRLFYGVVAALILVLLSGLAYRQLIIGTIYSDREEIQNLRRILVPGPRGNIFDRNGELLVGNRPRFAAVVYLAELRPEFRREFAELRRPYIEQHIPTTDFPLAGMARAAVVQRYLDEINALLDRDEQVDSSDLEQHLRQRLILPYFLVNDLAPEEYAKLVEQIPIDSPIQVYSSSVRHHPHGPAAAHVLGYVGSTLEIPEDGVPGERLMTFNIRGSAGREGLEGYFDDRIQGQTGGEIWVVDPAGFQHRRIERKRSVQGKDIVTTLDIRLQKRMEDLLGDYTAAALGELADQNQPFQVDIFEDDLSDPGDMARIRVVHASPDAPAVDITVEESGDALVEGAEFGDAAPVEVPAGSYTLEVRPATDANDGDVVATFPVDVDAETVYSAFAVGYLDPADAPADEAFDLEVVVDHAA